MHPGLSATLPPPHQLTAGLVLAAAPLAVAAAAAPAWARAALDVRWAASRQQDFLAGRAVAAQALQSLGFGAEPLPRGEAGAPCWPPGVTGSIAHGAGRAVALVGPARHWQGLGVDVEDDAPLPPDAACLVLTASDQEALAEGFGPEASQHQRLVFCAKECVHKAIHPWRGAWLGFEDVATRWQREAPDAGRWWPEPLSAAASAALAASHCEGRWWRADGALWATLTVRGSG